MYNSMNSHTPLDTGNEQLNNQPTIFTYLRSSVILVLCRIATLVVQVDYQKHFSRSLSSGEVKDGVGACLAWRIDYYVKKIKRTR